MPRLTKAADNTAQPGIVAAPVSDADRKQYLEHLKKINDVFYDQIKIADQKAAYIFTLMIAFLVTSPEGRSAFSFERYQGGNGVLVGLSLIMAAAATVTLIAAIFVVLPRHRGGAGTSLYWGAWQDNRERLLAAEAGGDATFLHDQYIGNIDNLSAINRAKYRSVKIAFRALTVLAVSYVALLVVSRAG